MLLPDCKYCSGFFAVICLLPFSLLLLPPLFPSCPAAVPVLPRCCFCLAPPLFLALFFLLFRLVLHCSRSAPTAVPAVVLSAAPAAPALFPWLFPPLFVVSFAELPVPSHAPCPAPDSIRTAPVPGTQPALGVIRKAAAKLRCSGLVAVTCLLCRIRPGNLTGAGPENLAGVPVRRILHGRP